MVILKTNVRTKAGLLPAGTDVEGKLPDEVIADLIDSGLASRTGKKSAAEKATDELAETVAAESGEDNADQDAPEEPEAGEDKVDLNLPDTRKNSGTTRGRRKKAKS